MTLWAAVIVVVSIKVHLGCVRRFLAASPKASRRRIPRSCVLRSLILAFGALSALGELAYAGTIGSREVAVTIGELALPRSAQECSSTTWNDSDAPGARAVDRLIVVVPARWQSRYLGNESATVLSGPRSLMTRRLALRPHQNYLPQNQELRSPVPAVRGTVSGLTLPRSSSCRSGPFVTTTEMSREHADMCVGE